jgi:outer membrane protein assembly factor BamA
MNLHGAAVLAYPFSRGTRVEFSAGVRHAAYLSDRRTQVSLLASGKVLTTDRQEFRGAPPTTVAEVGAALVHDTSVFGPTGPILGSRYRLEVAPAVGQMSYTGVTADVRNYFMPVRPYTVAVRVVHSARYGPDAGDPRLVSTFLGSSYFVRGHRDDLYYCRPGAERACGDELLGDRLLVGNVEIRVPISGILSRQIDYSFLPADAFAFVDAGMIRGGAATTSISSVGAGLRASALGFPVEIAAIRALDGPRPRWQFDFGFRIGF